MLKFFSGNKHHLVQTEDTSSISDWMEKEAVSEGQLSIDVYQTDRKIIIQSTIAGAKPEDLKVSLHHDLLTIHGTRKQPQMVADEQYLYRECYWGSFSRSIILPAEVDPRKVEANLENGVLTVSLTKTKPENIAVNFKD
ncbi:MAG TPA: Hsp20/alpha crystallin family protein [bacterium]|jgi:HSP20 family protein|nr:MAG: Spore protein SP21 [Parcubacteria group bacterium ADurb.Bin115]HNU81286.1 Hsp20/alpha crystallin family protein [bacterium]HOD87159.1 Hsp20/alpha crystallin family protein [bacterium]HPW05757.1 Hsp20/alpha crystallin family protein [bacterium]HQB76406.1 Hsp20/alpha crystallin family protein [bacterium]